MSVFLATDLQGRMRSFRQAARRSRDNSCVYRSTRIDREMSLLRTSLTRHRLIFTRLFLLNLEPASNAKDQRGWEGFEAHLPPRYLVKFAQN